MHNLEIILQIIIFPRKFVLLHSYTIASKKIIFLVIGYLWLANFNDVSRPRVGLKTRGLKTRDDLFSCESMLRHQSKVGTKLAQNH